MNSLTSTASGMVKLTKPVRDHDGRFRYEESPVLIRTVINLDRTMHLVKFADGATTWLFPDEVIL